MAEQTITLVMEVAAIRGGDEPAVTLVRQAERPDGRRRTITRVAGFDDAALFERFRREVNVGDTVRVQTVADWTRKPWPMLVLDFAKGGGAR